MTQPIPISRHPRWDGANITWVAQPQAPTRPEEVHPSSHRPFPLQDLLRAIGKELDELDAQSAVIEETPGGFAASHQLAGKRECRVYTHSELGERIKESRHKRQMNPRAAPGQEG